MRMQVAYECLMQAIAASKPGMRYREVGEIITKHARANGMSVVRTFCGHGIGDLFHCAPDVPHFAKNKAKGIMQVRGQRSHLTCFSLRLLCLRNLRPWHLGGESRKNKRLQPPSWPTSVARLHPRPVS